MDDQETSISGVTGGNMLVEELVEREKVTLLLSNFPFTLLFNTIAALIMVAAIWADFPAVYLLGWLLTSILVNGIRISHRRRFLTTKPENLDIKKFQRDIVTLTFISGLTWGVAPILFHSPGSWGYKLYFIGFLFILSVGANSLYASLPKAGNAFLAPAVLPISALFIYEGDRKTVLIGLMIPILGLAFSRITGTYARAIDEALRLRFENHMLVEDLKVEVTKRAKTANDMREAKDRAEEALKLKDKFVAIVSHDLRSPLSSLKMLTEHLLPMTERVGSERDKKLVNDAGERVTSLLAMTERLLDMRKIESGVVKPHKTLANLKELVEASVIDMAGVAKDKRITLENVVPPNIKIWTDTDLMRTVLQNLLDNSIKFTHKGGTVLIFAEQGESITITVKDNGVGIDRKKIDRLFTAHEKTSTDGTKGESGAGFGLPFCHDIVAVLGGEISVKSEVNAGSAFEVSLPNVWKKALVVNDQPIALKFVTTLLERLPLDVFEAEDGAQALRMVVEHRPDFIITDRRMPVMTGEELLKSVKSNPEIKNTPVIMVTSESENFSKEDAIGLGASSYFTQPLDPNEFIPHIKGLIG